MAEKVFKDSDRSSQRSRQALKRAEYGRQKSQDTRQSVLKLKQDYQDGINSFNIEMEKVLAKETYRLEKQEEAKQDVLENAG